MCSRLFFVASGGKVITSVIHSALSEPISERLWPVRMSNFTKSENGLCSYDHIAFSSSGVSTRDRELL